MKKKVMKDALALGSSALTFGVMGDAVTKAGGNAAGLNAFAGYMPTMGSVMGAGHTLNMFKQLHMKKKR